MITVRVAVRSVAAALICGASVFFGCAGIAHAHGTHVAPVEPEAPAVHTHRGPYSVLHQGPVPGPYSVLHEAH